MEDQSNACNVFHIKVINFFIRVQGLGAGYFHMESAFHFYGFRN